MTDGVLHTNTKPQEEEIASKRSVFITKALKNGKQTADFQTVDEGRNVILPELISSCSQQNLTFAVIDGFKIHLKK
jgi:hypothetical protein